MFLLRLEIIYFFPYSFLTNVYSILHIGHKENFTLNLRFKIEFI